MLEVNSEPDNAGQPNDKGLASSYGRPAHSSCGSGYSSSCDDRTSSGSSETDIDSTQCETIPGNKQASALPERAAPAFSFSRSARWMTSQNHSQDEQNSACKHSDTSSSSSSRKLLQAAEAAAAADAYATARRLLGLAPGDSSSNIDPAAAEAYAAARQVLGLPPDAPLAAQQQHEIGKQQKRKEAQRLPWELSACSEAAAAAASSKRKRTLQCPAVCADASQQLDACKSQPARQQQQQHALGVQSMLCMA
jgi:hypothetical protein